jgi:protein SCO1/2
MDSSIRRTVIVLVLVAALIFGVIVARQVMQSEAPSEQPAPELTELNTYVHDEPRALADFELVNEQGETVGPDHLKGQWTFAFLGYTHCPDVCPATMAMMRKAGERIPDDLPQPRFLLVSADPERDSPEKLKDYLAFFGDNFQALTGDIETLRELARSMNAVFIHREPNDGLILVDHSAHIALINPDGKMTAVLQPPHNPEQVAEAFEKIYQWAKARHPRAG